MKAEEQLFAYKELRNNGQAFFVDTYEDADRIIEALEKQIPKEPSQLLKHKDSFDWECPKCHMTYGCCNVNINYCYKCGQAIKWE